MVWDQIFGLLAGLMALLTYGIYFRQVLKGQSNPNPSTWAIWLFVGILNTLTYISITKNNIWSSLIAITVTFCALIIFLYSLLKGKFSRVSWIEITVFILAVAIGVFWRITADDKLSNIFLQVIYLVSFVPTIVGVMRGIAKEHYLACVIACIAYLFSIISLLFTSQVDPVAFVFPIVNGLLGNGFVAFLVIRKNLIKG